MDFCLVHVNDVFTNEYIYHYVTGRRHFFLVYSYFFFIVVKHFQNALETTKTDHDICYKIKTLTKFMTQNVLVINYHRTAIRMKLVCQVIVGSAC